MDITTFHASRRYADVRCGRIAFFEKGEGPAALFVHGVPLNGYHWRNIIERVQHRRRCIAYTREAYPSFQLRLYDTDHKRTESASVWHCGHASIVLILPTDPFEERMP